jgi:hypothetical protein
MRFGDRLSTAARGISTPRRAALVVALGITALRASPAAAAHWAPSTSAVPNVVRHGITIVSHPAKATRSRTATFRWKVAGRPVRVVCSLGRRPFVRCHQPKRYTKLLNGVHRFRVRAVYRSTSKTATYRWRVDTIAPSAPQVTGGAASWRSAAEIDIAGGSSKDSGSGVAGYQFRQSTDGGATWSAPAAGRLAAITAEGKTSVEFRTRDRAGNLSAWAPTLGDAGAAWIDRTAPSDPIISGGSLEWQNADLVTVSASGATDTGSGLAGYQFRASTDGGATWSASSPGADAAISSEGETLVEFQALDAAGNASDWQPAAPGDANTVRIDHTLPTAPEVTGGSTEWQSVASVVLSADGSIDGTGGAGIDHYEYRESTDGGDTWSAPVVGDTDTVSGEGETLVAFRAVDGTSLASAWAKATVRLDRTAPTDPSVDGDLAGWQSVPSETVSASDSSDGSSGVDHYEYRESSDGGVTWSPPAVGAADMVTAEGQTLVALRAVDGAGNPSAWIQRTVAIDRTQPGAPTAVAGGSAAWQNAVSVTLSASGAGDAGSGLAGYEYRTSTDAGDTWSSPLGGADASVTGEGETLVEFRSVDNAGNVSEWTPLPPDTSGTVRIDRTNPSIPSITGGSLTWQSTASVTISGSGAADSGSGVDQYEYEASTDGGTTWSSPAQGASLAVAAEGETLVRFRAVDAAGNQSDWAPASSAAENTVRIDRTAPSNPSVTGGSAAWQSTAGITISGSGSTDARSGVAGYQYRTSSNGTAWSAAAAGASVQITAQGTTFVQFRTLDNAGNASAWSPASTGSASTAKIDRTAPTAPSVSGGATACTKKRTIKASGSTDALSGIDHYEYRYSANGGAYTVPASGASANFNKTGTYTVQFRAFDRAGNISSWAPSVNSSANTACIR